MTIETSTSKADYLREIVQTLSPFPPIEKMAGAYASLTRDLTAPEEPEKCGNPGGCGWLCYGPKPVDSYFKLLSKLAKYYLQELEFSLDSKLQ